MTEGFERRSPLFPNIRFPICILVLHTSPSSSLKTSRTLANFHSFRGPSSFTITMSPGCTFRLAVRHRCLREILARYSFFHLPQNCSHRYCTCLHRFLI